MRAETAGPRGGQCPHSGEERATSSASAVKKTSITQVASLGHVWIGRGVEGRGRGGGGF